MPIRTICPECQTAYQLADQQAGKQVRCKKCQTVFEVAESPSRQTTIRGDKAPATQMRQKAPTVTMRRGDEGAADEPEQSSPGPTRNVRKNHTLLWVLGGAAVGFGLLLLVAGGVIGALLMRDQPAEMVRTNVPPPVQMQAPQPPPVRQPFNQPAVNPPPPADKPVQGQPVEQAAKQTAKEAKSKPAGEDKPRDASPAQNGRLSSEGRDHVKRATVYLRVKMADGTQVSGSGFLGCKEARNIVLTNAHVVGMLSPESARPIGVEVIFNSGETSEWKTSARVLGVDRASDLAVLDMGTPPQQPPEPLTVKSAGGLHELDDVYVFGFPLGETGRKLIGKEVTIRPASVSAMRKKNGVLERVQVNGGMDPGNSGGPVVDNSGAVVGVAVSGFEGRQINFAIPGERVHAILEGRIADLTLHQPYFTDDNKLAVPVVMGMIDPRNHIQEVGLELWTGDKPADENSGHRPAATAQPAAQTGDSTHTYYRLKYMAPEGKSEILLPELPAGKVYWKQPKWIDAKGQAHWASADPMQLPAQPVYRKPTSLVLRYQQGSRRQLDLDLETAFKVSQDEDSDAAKIRNIVTFRETVVSTGSGGTQLKLSYVRPPERDLLVGEHEPQPHPMIEHIRPYVPNMTTTLQLDRLGNITGHAIDPRVYLALGQSKPEHVQNLKDFHDIVQQGLESLTVSLPNSGSVKPLESWKAERRLPIDTPGRAESANLEAAFMYQGIDKRNGREEAIITMDGLVRGKNGEIGGRASGHYRVDMLSGQTLVAETNVKLQLRALLNKPGEAARELRVLANMKFRMQRKL